MGGLSVRSLRELKTIVGVISEDVRLFHAQDVGAELSRRNPLMPRISGNFVSLLLLISMRVLAAIILLFVNTATLAESTDERKSGARPPTAIEVISGLYSFSRFQQGLLENTDLKGNAEVKNLAALRAEEAAERDKKLKGVQEAIGAELHIAKVASPTASLVEPEMSDGPTYVKSFYAAQIPEYEAIIGLLERYLTAPDHAALAAFAREQLPFLRAQARDAERTMADK